MGSVDVSAALAARLQDIPGVAQVVVDLDDSSGGIHVRLEPGADEDAVLEKMRTLLVAYGLRPRDGEGLALGRQPQPRKLEAFPNVPEGDDLGVEVVITPTTGGARVEVATDKVRSFRVVKPTPLGIAQGLADAWCQVVGRVPVAVVDLSLDGGELVVTVRDGDIESTGKAAVSEGWSRAVPHAVGRAAGLVGVVPPPLAVNS